MLQPKEFFIEKLEHDLQIDENTKILDLGSGWSKNFLPLLKKFPRLNYVGVEANPKDAEKAREILKDYKNVKIYNQLAYSPIPGCVGYFDVCLSFSALEHVKQLDEFLVNSINSVKPGGYIIHRYDLGHALHPVSLKEKVNVFIGNNFPRLLPEHKFLCYLDERKVCSILESHGAVVNNVSYHQMPNHKDFLKNFPTDSVEKKLLAQEILEWEFKVSPFLSELDKAKREKLFPAVTIWAQRKMS